MKAKYSTSFSTKILASQFQPVESTESIEIDIEFENDKDLEKKIEHYQKLIRRKSIESTMKGVIEVLEAKDELLSQDED